MNDAAISIRVLDSADAKSFQRLRLSGLLESPEAFCSSHVQEADTPLTEIAERLKPEDDWSWILGAFTAEGELVGLVGFHRERGAKHAHKAMLWGFYVAPPLRGHGIGRRLIEQFMVRARAVTGLRQVKLSVNPAQTAAVRLYVSFGFRSFGRESHALKIGEAYFDEEYMVLLLGDG